MRDKGPMPAVENYIMTTPSPVVRLQQDNHDKLVVAIPRAQAEQAIKSAMNYRNTGKSKTYLQRLYTEGSLDFDACIAKLHARYAA